MRKVFKMENLDCAHCASKVENGIAKIEGVTFVSVNFMAQRLTIEANEEGLDRILLEARKVCKKVNPDILIK